MARILVLDDIPEAGMLLRRILGKRGHRVEVFTDEDEALGFAAENELDLAIIDVKLRKMEGFEVLAELIKVRPEVRAIILLTGYPTPEAALRARALGAAYCAKPIDKEELERKVEAALAGEPGGKVN